MIIPSLLDWSEYLSYNLQEMMWIRNQNPYFTFILNFQVAPPLFKAVFFVIKVYSSLLTLKTYSLVEILLLPLLKHSPAAMNTPPSSLFMLCNLVENLPPHFYKQPPSTYNFPVPPPTSLPPNVGSRTWNNILMTSLTLFIRFTFYEILHENINKFSCRMLNHDTK